MMSRKFDLSKPETLLMPESVDDALYNQVNEKLFRQILRWGQLIGVSDVVIQSDVPVKVKVNNQVHNITRAPVSLQTAIRFVGIVYKAKEGDDTAFQRIMSGKDTDTNYEFQTGKPGEKKKTTLYRVNCQRDGMDGVSMVMRLNNDDIPSLESIGQSPDGEIYKNMFPLKGLVLITGPVDSGKTTLIYAALKHFILNDPRHAFIDTYENPIEGNLKRLVIENGITNKSVRQCPVPIGVSSYSEGVDKALRRNVDIMLAGEVRTQAEVEGVLKALLSTGKLVMGTLHTDSVPVTINRLINTLHSSNEGKMRSLVYDLIGGLRMIVSQKLLNTVDNRRIAVNETLVMTREIKERLQKVPMERLSDEIANIMRESGNTMVDKAQILFEKGVISEDVFTSFKEEFAY